MVQFLPPVISYSFIFLGQRPSIIIPVEGELRRFSHIIGGVFSYSAFIPRLGKISSFDIHIARKMVYVGSRKNRAIKGFHFNGKYFYFDLIYLRHRKNIVILPIIIIQSIYQQCHNFQ